MTTRAIWKATWRPHDEKNGKLSDRSDLPDSVYAFPKERKEPLTDARHVRAALARFGPVKGIRKTERDLAFKNITKAAKHYGVDVCEKSVRGFDTKANKKMSPTMSPRK